MLREICEADYAQYVTEHFLALKPIWEGNDWTELDYLIPMEVLELIRWSEPEVPEWKPGSVGIRGHKMRAFSCSVLLATSNFEPDQNTLIQMLDSVSVIGQQAEGLIEMTIPNKPNSRFQQNLNFIRYRWMKKMNLETDRT